MPLSYHTTQNELVTVIESRKSTWETNRTHDVAHMDFNKVTYVTCEQRLSLGERREVMVTLSLAGRSKLGLCRVCNQAQHSTPHVDHGP